MGVIVNPVVPDPPVSVTAPDPLAETELDTYVYSFNSRTGDVVPAVGDYTSDMITNDSNVAGASVTGALDYVQTNLFDPITTQYRMVYVGADETLAESSTIVTDASGNLNVTGIVTADVFVCDPTYVATGSETAGSIFWDTDNDTVSVHLRGTVTGQLFEESFIAGQNDTAGTLDNGTVATYAGGIGASGNIRIANSVATAGENPILTLGIVTEDIPNTGMNYGKVTTYGKVRGIQTDGVNYGESWSEGDILYKSATIAGGLTNVAPAAPIPAIPVAVVIAKHASNGTLLVRPTFPQALTDLTDVNGTALTTDGQLAVWDNGNGYFDFTANINDYIIGTGLSTTYAMLYVSGSGTIAESSTITTDANGSLITYGDATNANIICHADTLFGSSAISMTGDFAGTPTQALLVTASSADVRFAYHGSNMYLGYTGTNQLTFTTTAVTVNSSAADVDFSAQGDTDTALFYCNAGTDSVHIGTNAQVGSEKFGVNGTAYISGALTADGEVLIHADGGTDNTFVGKGCGTSISTGFQNVGMGMNCLNVLTTGDRNYAGGRYTLANVLDADGNVAVGYFCGYYYNGATGNLTDATNCVFIGREATPLANAPTNEIVIGYSAIGHGSNTVTIGNSSTVENYLTGALLVNATALVGTETLSVNGTAYISDKLTVDQYIEIHSTGSLTNTFVGYLTAVAATGTSQSNTAIGEEAMRYLTSGDYNTACGRNALKATTTQNRNTAVGYNAGGSASGAYDSVFIGYNAGTTAGTTSGYNHAIVGSNAMSTGTNGHSSAIVGTDAGYAAGAYFRAAFLGHEAGRYVTTGEGAVLIGWRAAYVASTAGGGGQPTTITDSVLIGNNTKPYDTSTSHEIIIGSDAEGMGDNITVIGHTTQTDCYIRGDIHVEDDHYVYLKGDASTNDSIRLSYQSGSDEVILEARDTGVWTPKHTFNMA